MPASAGGFGALANRPCHPPNRLSAGFPCQTPVSNRRGVLGPGPASVPVFIGCRRFGQAEPRWGSAIPMPSHPTGFEPVLPARRRFRTGGACLARPSIGSRHHPQPFAHRAETGQAVASNRGQRPSADPYSLTIQLSSSVIVSEWRPRASLPSSAGFRLKKLNQRHDTQGGAWFHAAFCFDMNMIGIAG